MEEDVTTSVDWWAYFKSIRTQCPWSYVAYNQGLIDIVDYQGVSQPLGNFSARMYLLSISNQEIENLCQQLDQDDTECQWLFSYPGYGDYATPVSCLIQQHRSVLDDLRAKINY